MVPAVRLCERSWDFMPPDLVRPVATTNIFNIAIMAYRLGMTWIDFRPEENVMRAEGNGQLLNSTHVRSIGIILQYLKTRGDIEDSINDTFNPSEVADALNFGIILTNIPFFLQGDFSWGTGKDLKIGTIDEILFSMAQIDCTKDAIKKAKDTYSVGKKAFGFSDIIPLMTPMMHVKGNTLIRLPVPAEHCDGLTSHREGNSEPECSTIIKLIDIC